MTDSYKTMKFSSIRESGYGWQRKYECQVCHGVLLDRESANSLSPECFKPVAVADMTCSLCDETAPLTDQYWMGLTTVQDACWDARGVPVDCADYGFPSFERTRRSLYQENDMYVSFRVDGGPLISARPDEIGFAWTENWFQIFDSILNGQIEPLNPRRLALEVVNRVRHDLKLEYAKEA